LCEAYDFFQLNFTIIFGISNLKGGYALLIIKLIIKAEWVVLNAEKSLKERFSSYHEEIM